MNTFEENLVEMLEKRYSVPFVNNASPDRYVGLVIKNEVRLQIILSIGYNNRAYLFVDNDNEEITSRLIKDLDYVVDFLNRAETFLGVK